MIRDYRTDNPIHAAEREERRSALASMTEMERAVCADEREYLTEEDL